MKPHGFVAGLIRAQMGTALVALTLSACTQVPELDQAVPEWVRKAKYPELVALDVSLTSGTLPEDESAQIERYLSARRDQLIRRAGLLKSSVIDGQTQDHMKSDVSQ